MQTTESRKMAGRKMAIKARRSSFFCPAFFCWRIRVPGFYKCVLTSAAVSFLVSQLTTNETSSA
jgi:hypothetical protein